MGRNVKRMGSLSGKISDKLRALFAPGDKAWNPGRPASPTKKGKKVTGVEGHSMTGRGKKSK